MSSVVINSAVGPNPTITIDNTVRLYATGGGGGGGIKIFVQSINAPVWTVVHNLGYQPTGIMTIDSGGNEFKGDITHQAGNNSFTVTFYGGSFAGTVNYAS